MTTARYVKEKNQLCIILLLFDKLVRHVFCILMHLLVKFIVLITCNLEDTGDTPQYYLKSSSVVRRSLAKIVYP